MADGEEVDRQPIYRIKVKGKLGEDWSNWLDRMAIRFEINPTDGPITTLLGPIADQAALRGILTRIWDLNLTVISVSRLERGHGPEPG